MDETLVRCDWVNLENPLMVEYHDTEWCTPNHDENTFFEFLVLEAAQAGLSWETVLNKREAYKQAFFNFDPVVVSQLKSKDLDVVLNHDIIKNRLKAERAVENAKTFLKIQDEFGSFDQYIWSFVGFRPIVNKFTTRFQLPDKTRLSTDISLALAKKGFWFVGPTITYAFMQAMGMINDHIVTCFRREELLSQKAA